MSLYADDKKIWRSISTENDHICLQKDIDYLHDWSLRNKMKFHPNKCKVLAVTGRMPVSLLSELPFYDFFYNLGGVSLDYVDAEKDLGVVVTASFDWAEQCQKVYSKANQKLGLLRRSCHFVIDENRKRVLYLTLVRSQFEHCSIIWRPVTQTLTKRLEDLQKRAVKWILSEENVSYSPALYVQKCRQLNLLPLSERFNFLDLVFFFKVLRGLVPVELPPYITPYIGSSRLRSSHMDHLCFVCSISPRSANGAFGKNFFYRTHCNWNYLPLDIKGIVSIDEFKSALLKHMWKAILRNNDIENDDDMLEDGC